MKKYTYIALMGLLAGCTGAIKAPKESPDMRSCLIEKATTYLQDGSALASPMRSTVKKMLNACIAPANQTPEDKKLAQSILLSLMNGESAQ